MSAPRRSEGLAKRLWRRVRGPLAQSDAAKAALVWLIASYLKWVHATNRVVTGPAPTEEMARALAPCIVTFWHGQHLMGPFLRPKGFPLVAMFSRSADAELNARVAEKLGLMTVRGSGGRGRTNPGKGGVRALLTLRNALKQGRSASMIADIAHGKPREAGEGIVLLAKLSGRPIVPVAQAYSRRRVLEKTWDKTAIPLPFGRASVIYGEPLWVAAEAEDDELEAARRELTRRLNDATEQAYAALTRTK